MALRLVVERSQADHDGDRALRRQLTEQVDVAQAQRALGHDGDGVPVREQHLDQLACRPVFPRRRLVRVGVPRRG